MDWWLGLITFLLVSGLALLAGGWWMDRHSPQAKARSRRLNSIREDLDVPGASPGAQRPQGLDALDKWLREHVPAYARLDRLIARAHSTQSSMQVLGWSLSLGMLAALLSALAGVPFWASLALGLGGLCVPVLRLRRAATQRRNQFEDKLPEALDFIARALRAGHSITVALGMAGNELADPIGVEFKTVFDEIGFGIPFNEALTSMARRLESADLDFLVIALLIQRETGGNLTELLESLARTVRDRIKLHGKVRTLSSEGKFSAMLLGSLPFVLGLILSLLNPGYMGPLWQTPEGFKILGTGAVLLVLGFFILSRIIRIKV